MARNNRNAQVQTTEVEVETAQAVEPQGKLAGAITQTTEELIKEHGNKSNAIRALDAKGFSRSQIATALGIRYQHVRNVLLQPLKRQIKAERDNGKTETTNEGQAE